MACWGCETYIARTVDQAREGAYRSALRLQRPLAANGPGCRRPKTCMRISSLRGDDLVRAGRERELGSLE